MTTLLALCVMALLQTSFEHDSLIANGSGQWPMVGEAHPGWQSWGGGRRTEPGLDDEGLIVRIDGAEPGAECGYLSTPFWAARGALYMAGARVRATDLAGEAHVAISWHAADHRWLCNTDDGVRITGTSEWVDLVVGDYPPEDAAYGRLALRCDGLAGSAGFCEAWVRVSQPERSVLMPVPGGDPGEARYLLTPGVCVTPSEYHPRGGTVLETTNGGQRTTVLPPAASGMAGVGVIEKAFSAAPTEAETVDTDRLALAVAMSFLSASRWLVPPQFDLAVSEMFGARATFCRVVAAAHPLLDHVEDKREAALLAYLSDLWSTQDPSELHQRSYDLVDAYGGTDVRSDQIIWLQGTAQQRAEQSRHDRELTAITEELATADLAGSRRLLLARARLNLDAERPGLALADAQRVLGSYPEGRPVPALVYVTLAQAALAAGDPLAAKGWAETGASVASGGGYMARLAYLAWQCDVAAGAAGVSVAVIEGLPAHRIGGWAGRFGSAGALLCGPEGGVWADGCLADRPDDQPVAVRTATPGTSARTQCTAFPAEQPDAPFYPPGLCASDSYWDDRGEIYGDALAGPDLLIDVKVPPGVHTVAVLTGEYAMEVTLIESGAPLAESGALPAGGMYYRTILVPGPLGIRIRLKRGSALMTYAYGVFVDQVGPMTPAARYDESPPAIGEGRDAASRFGEWVSSETPDSAVERLWRLVRTPGAFEEASVPAAEVLAETEPAEGLRALMQGPAGADSRMVHWLAEALASSGPRLQAIDPSLAAVIVRRLDVHHDYGAAGRFLVEWGRAVGVDALRALQDGARSEFEQKVVAQAMSDLGAPPPRGG